jgi:hypothetical protein
MRAANRKNRRRATVLLLVVSLLALLFVIVTGFLSLARNGSRLSEDVSRSDVIDAIVEDMDAWAISLVKDQIVDDAGQVLPGGSGETFSWEVIPGYRESNFLAALEPVWDPTWSGINGWTGTWNILERLRWPALTTLDDSVSLPQPFRLFELLLDYDFTNLAFRTTDVQWNARNPFMDADGDGVPDSHFLLCAAACEAANTMAGTSIQLPRLNDGTSFVSYNIPDASWNDARWRRYDEHARYEVAMRIIAHSGMVTLDSPTLYDIGNNAYLPFNRDFTIDLFDAIRVGGMSLRRQYQNAEQNRLFDELEANQGGVEAPLRRRFTLPSPPDEVDRFDTYRRIPPVLAELQGETDRHPGFPETLIPHFTNPYSLSDPKNWQRVNIGVDSRPGDQRDSWARTVAQDADAYNSGAAGPPWQPDSAPYRRRHFVTTVNYSDELARKQESNDPKPTMARPLDFGTIGSTTNPPRGATYEGELKFYLGEVAKAFREVDDAGMTQAGTGWYSYDVTNGNLIIERLARLYYDMLRSHSGSGSDWGNAANPDDDGPEAASRRQQAFMLAVNTVAFAAPRSTRRTARGFIPVVSYADVTVPGMFYDNQRGNGSGANELRYIGYTPQPFFTEVIAYKEADADPNDPNYVSDPNDPLYDDPNVPNLVLAVELYNPNTPCFEGWQDAFGPVDAHGLWLSQFAISVNGANPGDPNAVGEWQRFETAFGFGLRLNGRSFMRLVIENDQSSHFDPLISAGAPDFAPKIELDLEEDPSEPEKLTLWRWDWRDVGTGTPTRIWFPIDEIEIGQTWPGTGFWRSAYRDTSPNLEYAAPDYEADGLFEYARWNVITRQRTVAPTTSGAAPLTGSIGNSSWLELSGNNPDPGGYVHADDLHQPPRAFSPTTTLITMNAGPVELVAGEPLYRQFNNLPMFGAFDPQTGRVIDPRPRSFPTVGFLLFVPRFAHMQKVIAGAEDPILPMSATLAKQWSNQSHAISNGSYLTSADYPVDFGHMPLFDNTQDIPSGSDSYFDNSDGVGRVPWGQLVFDYFTTLDPTRDVNADGVPDVDPLRVPGRININAAPWYVLANLPLLGPDGNNELPVRPYGTGAGVDRTAVEPSPAFWDPAAGMLVGGNWYGAARLLAQDALYTGNTGFAVPFARFQIATELPVGRYRLGPWLAQSAAAYRDGLPYVSNSGTAWAVYSDAQERNLGGFHLRYRADGLYGTVRGRASASGGQPTQFGFVSVGELLNVKGLDSSTHVDLLTPDANGVACANSAVARGDFVKAVSIVALLDSQYLSTRGNTFTAYTSVMDRAEPEASVRSQVTVDRSNLLPRLTYAFDLYNPTSGVHTYYPLAAPYLNDPAYAVLPVVPRLLDFDGDTVLETPIRATNEDGAPRVIANEQAGYFNAFHDD